MDKHQFINKMLELVSANELNYIPEKKALDNTLIAEKMFDNPLIAVADADDSSFLLLKQEDIIGKHFMLPQDWLPEAKCVISFFFPFTELIRVSNRDNKDYPSKGWLNGRIEGQSFINNFSAQAVDFLRQNNYKALSPSIDERFFANTGIDGTTGVYVSNWSERHAAYICGLGTFSLSRGLITERGMAGRLTSIITDLQLPADVRHYKRFDENCIMCGKCIKNCPVNAISFEKGKDNDKCSSFLSLILSENAPWYGCGKCQVNVPCECRNPNMLTG